MNKRLITVGLAILAAAIFLKSVFVLFSKIEIDEFHKAAITFVVDSSKYNQNGLAKQIQYIRTLCATLDPEDTVKIIKTDNSSYLIFEGSAGDGSGISSSLKKYTATKGDKTSYGEALKKAVDYSLTMKKNGYNTAIVVLGSLENDGDEAKRLNWDTFPQNIKKTQKYLPELAMMFLFADPEKLDYVKTKLNPVLGEDKLIIANEVNIDKTSTRFIKAIGR